MTQIILLRKLARLRVVLFTRESLNTKGCVISVILVLSARANRDLGQCFRLITSLVCFDVVFLLFLVLLFGWLGLRC